MPSPIGSLLLAHGAGSGPWVFRSWPKAFPDVEVVAVDLTAGLDMETASMENYVAAVLRAAGRMPRPLALCGWSMGGLVALMAAASVEPDALVLLEPSPPSEIQGSDSGVEPQEGSFDPEEVYGAFPSGVLARPESQFARDERKRGISVPSIVGRCLVVFGNEFPDERGRRVVDLYGAESHEEKDLDHWGLVLHPQVPKAVREWLEAEPATG